MGQLTLARFRGDTTFGLTARVLSTFGGGLIGACMWYALWVLLYTVIADEDAQVYIITL